jgi:hypothetical protein
LQYCSRICDRLLQYCNRISNINLHASSQSLYNRQLNLYNFQIQSKQRYVHLLDIHKLALDRLRLLGVTKLLLPYYLQFFVILASDGPLIGIWCILLLLQKLFLEFLLCKQLNGFYWIRFKIFSLSSKGKFLLIGKSNIINCFVCPLSVVIILWKLLTLIH